MAIAIVVDGPASISVAALTGGTLTQLGYSENGVEVTEQLFTGDVMGDQNGGDQGPPIDVQYFGEIHVVRLLLTNYDETVLNTIRAGVAGGTAGTPGTAGSLYFQGGLAWRLLINSTNRPRNYLNAIFKEPKEVNKGTKHSKAMIVATCYNSASNIMYNTTTS